MLSCPQQRSHIFFPIHVIASEARQCGLKLQLRIIRSGLREKGIILQIQMEAKFNAAVYARQIGRKFIVLFLQKDFQQGRRGEDRAKAQRQQRMGSHQRFQNGFMLPKVFLAGCQNG